MDELSLNNSTHSVVYEQNEYSTQVVWMYTVRLLTGIFASIGNGITLAIIKKYPALRTHQDVDAVYLILFLAVADGLNGLGGVVTGSCMLYLEVSQGFPTRGQCVLCTGAHVFGNFCSQVMLITVAVDRLTAVRDPVGYQAKNHFKYAYFSFIFTIVYSVVSFLLRLIGDLREVVSDCGADGVYSKGSLLYWVSFQLLSSLAVIGFYIVLVALVHKKSTQGMNMHESVYSDQLKRQTLVTRAVVRVLLIYLLFWVFPISLSFGAIILKLNEEVVSILAGVLGIGSNVSAGANIFVYAYKIPLMKTFYKKFFRLDTNTTNAVGPIVFQREQLQE